MARAGDTTLTPPGTGCLPECARAACGLYMDCMWLYTGNTYCIWVCVPFIDCIRTVYRLYAASRLVYVLRGLYMDCVWLYTAVYELYGL